MKHSVPPGVVAERRERLLALERELVQKYQQTLVGMDLDVMVETPDPDTPGRVRGTSCRYAPVVFEGYAPALVGRRVPVRAERVADGLVFGSPLPAQGLEPASLPGGSRLSRHVWRMPLPQISETSWSETLAPGGETLLH
jgi:hypothetical protein